MKPKLQISRAVVICIRNGIKVYPVVSGRSFQVEVDDNGNKIKYNKKVYGNDLNVAISKTYKAFAESIIKQQDANKTTKKEKTLGTGAQAAPKT